ncbi:DUF2931 family protein [Pseudomonas brenneri]|uniref:DUF2931 family protein n=1 Tax=Pseudomonas fluorescens group TaxID=136843 RepID=UPI000426AF13|nr:MULTISPECIES: DUF2931 family protein [Pseudomonas fluorescens group]MBF8005655.1 DUF2931 family protein [Pseudomonas brenneri]WJM89166.1 DUF2931 family protein [Pseudomonas brenneri]
MAVIAAVLFCFSLAACQSKDVPETYSWSGSVSAPQEYPMEVYRGALIAEDFTYDFDAIWGTQNTGWGHQGGTMTTGIEKKAVPYQLAFTWYSLVEKKFYTGQWTLDKEKIKRLLDEGFIDQDTHKKDTYNTFIVGLAPQGRVVLWVSGAGNQKEVGAFEAQVTAITKESAYSNAQYMFKDGYADRMLNDPSYKTFSPQVRQKIQTQGYPSPGIYDTYREKYSWRPVVVLQEGAQWLDFGFSAYNGEQENIFGKELLDNHYEKRAIPKFCGFYWRDGSSRYGVWVDAFDEKEIFDVFQKLGKEKHIDLVVKVDAQNTRVSLLLRSGAQEFPIGKAKVRLSHKIE